MSTAETLYTQALQLSEDERVALAHRLFESVPPLPPSAGSDEPSSEEVEAAWAHEVTARLAALERGEVKTRPFREAMTDLRAKLIARRAGTSS
ncbi:MAG: addiction module protein [Alphaproteobacteria bacterium]|nr:addiction module protein [Alphaproteobacteria bacterium]